MFDLYLISIFDSLIGSCVVLTILGIVALVTMICCSACNLDLDPSSSYQMGRIKVNNFMIKWCRPAVYIGLVAFILAILIPNTKQGYFIYGISNTIEYVQNNEKAKELPDKAVEALSRYLDECGKDKNPE